MVRRDALEFPNTANKYCQCFPSSESAPKEVSPWQAVEFITGAWDQKGETTDDSFHPRKTHTSHCGALAAGIRADGSENLIVSPAKIPRNGSLSFQGTGPGCMGTYLYPPSLPQHEATTDIHADAS